MGEFMAKTCFFIGPIGDDTSSIRDWSDMLLEYVVAPAVTELGYEYPKRADKILETSSISSTIMKMLVESDLVIADLTNGNPNAFYELGIRHLLEKPSVHIMRDGEKIPFDVKDVPVIFINLDTPRKTDKSKSLLKSKIEAIEKDDAISMPHIKFIRDAQKFWESSRSNAEKEDLIILLERLDNLQDGVNSLKGDVLYLIKQLAYPKDKSTKNSVSVERRKQKAQLIKEKRQKHKTK